MKRVIFGFVVLAAAVMPKAASAYTYAYSLDNFCSGSVPLAVRRNHPIRVVCANPPQYQALGIGQFMGDVFANVFWSYVMLNPYMPHLGLERNNCAPPSSLQNDDLFSTARDSAITYSPTLINAGDTNLRESCSFDSGWVPEVVEADTFIRQSNNPVRALINTNPVVPDPVQSNRCRPSWTVEGTLVHELGHGYGFLHFDDWMSTMVTYQQLDFVACNSLTGEVIPSSDVQQAFRNHPSYGLPGGTDLSGYNVYSNDYCNLRTNSLCFTSLAPDNTGGFSDYVNPGPGGLLTRPIRIVYSNNRNEVPNNYWVDFYISRDGQLDSGDTLVGYEPAYGRHSGAIYRMDASVTFDRNLLPAGRSCILALVDGTAQYLETNETDNVTLTRTCFDRSGW